MGIELIIIIIIGLVIMFLSGGISLPIPIGECKGDCVRTLNANEYHCEEVVWQTAPQMTNNHFGGTIQIDCTFKGLSGGGIMTLRKRMEEQLPATAETIYSGPEVENFDGLPSLVYDLTLKMQAENEEMLVRGKTHLATNGFTKLRNVFISTDVPDEGSGKYIRSLETEVNVTTTEKEGWYRLRLVNKNQIEKPWYISSDDFKRALVQGTEKEFKNRAEQVVSDVANHL